MFQHSPTPHEVVYDDLPEPTTQPSSAPGDVNLLQYMGGDTFRWEDGTPKPRSGLPAMQREQVQDLINAGAALAFQGSWNPATQQFDDMEGGYSGLTMAEATIKRAWAYAAAGDKKFVEMMLDRMLGKPKQAIEATIGHISLPDRLEEIRLRNMHLFTQTIDVRPEVIPRPRIHRQQCYDPSVTRDLAAELGI